MARIAVLTMSDGRDFVARDVHDFVVKAEERVATTLANAGHEVVRARDAIWTNQLATSEARRIAAHQPDLTVFHYPVWAFPHFTMLAAAATDSPLLLLANIDPQYPGMVGMLAGGGALDQIGRIHARAWGDIGTPATADRILVQVRAAAAVRGLRGSTFGRIGGRPMGMYTAVANTDQWMRHFGVDVEEIDQWEIVTSGTSATQDNTPPGTRPAATTRWRTSRVPTSTRKCSISRPVVPRCTTWRPLVRRRSRG